MLDKIITIDNELVNQSDVFFEKILSYKTENAYKYLIKTKLNYFQKINWILARYRFCK